MRRRDHGAMTNVARRLQNAKEGRAGRHLLGSRSAENDGHGAGPATSGPLPVIGATAGQGLEPQIPGPEPDVLPITPSRIGGAQRPRRPPEYRSLALRPRVTGGI